MRCCRNISLTAGGASVASHGGRSEGRAAFPLAGSSRLTGIKSNATTPRRMVMRHGGRHGVRARRFPRKTQARASIGNAHRASPGSRGRKGSRSRVKRRFTRRMYDPAEILHPERKRPQDAFHPAAAERSNPHLRYFPRSQNSAIFISRFSFNSEMENLIVRLSRTLSSSSSLSMIMTCFLPTALPEELSSSIM